jgi:hypothetical protein
MLVEHADGATELLAIPPTGESSWSITLPGGDDIHTVSAVSIVDSVGRVWCRGTFAALS